MAQNLRQFTVILDREPDGNYSVFCPALPGCCSLGEDRDNALSMIREAIALVLDVVERRKAVDPAQADLPLIETSALIAEEFRQAFEFRLEEGDPVNIEVVRVEVGATVPA